VRMRSDESLLRLRTSQLAMQEAELAHSRNKLELEKRRSELERIQRHFDPDTPETSRIFTREAWEAARLEYDKAVNTVETSALALDKSRGEVAAAALQLSYTDVKAPISGVITQRNVRANELASTSTLLYQITDLSVLEVRLDVAEARLSMMREPRRVPGVSVLGLDEKVAVGSAQAALLSITAFPRERFLGYLDRISPTVDEARGMVVVIVRLIQPRDVDPELHAPLLAQFDRGTRRAVLATAESARGGTSLALRPGMWVDARIATQHIENALLIPGASIVGDSEIIWVVTPDADDPDAGTVRSVSIAGRRGVSSEGFVEITPAPVVAQPRQRPEADNGATAERKGDRRGKGRGGEAPGGTDVIEGTLVVVRGQSLLRDGQRVRIRELAR
jgi:multidrug efflux pump subunit AcrA (membrane-fusion protein)